jgi:hypothetical protein
MKHVKIVLSAVVLSSGLAGCGGSAGDAGTLEPNGGIAGDIPSQGAKADALTYMQSHGRLITAPVVDRGAVRKTNPTRSFYSNGYNFDYRTNLYDSGWLCVLTGMGGASYIAATIEDDPNRGGWVLSTYVENQAWAECTQWSNFLFPSGSVIWVSPIIGSAAASSGNWATDIENAWWGDAVTMISGSLEKWSGFGEWMQVIQSTNGFSPSTFWTHEENHTDFFGQAYSIFIGVPSSGRLVKVIGYQGGAYGPSDVTQPDTEAAVSTESGYSAYWLAPTDRSICYLSMVSGHFNGLSENLHIWNNNNQWFLQATRGPNGTVQGRARCLAYDQR